MTVGTANKTTKKKRNSFVMGPITPDFISDKIKKHQSKTGIGAHDIFLGQVRADKIDNKYVQSIKYTAYQEMAENVIYEIREAAFSKFEMECMHIYHSLGEVKAGEICLFVFVSSKRRRVAFEATEYIVEEIKERLPVFGKEVLSDESHVWKVNN
jgi:molybdopterin synthase catalytic subunit